VFADLPLAIRSPKQLAFEKGNVFHQESQNSTLLILENCICKQSSIKLLKPERLTQGNDVIYTAKSSMCFLITFRISGEATLGFSLL